MSARLMVQVSSAPTTRGPRMLAKVSTQITPAVAKTLAGGVPIAGNELGEIAHRGDRDRDVADPVAEPVDVVGLEADVGAEEVARVGVGPALLRIQLAQLGEHQPERRGAGGGHDPAEDGDAADRGEIDREQEDARCRSCCRPRASWPASATSCWPVASRAAHAASTRSSSGTARSTRRPGSRPRACRGRSPGSARPTPQRAQVAEVRTVVRRRWPRRASASGCRAGRAPRWWRGRDWRASSSGTCSMSSRTRCW